MQVRVNRYGVLINNFLILLLKYILLFCAFFFALDQFSGSSGENRWSVFQGLCDEGLLLVLRNTFGDRESNVQIRESSQLISSSSHKIVLIEGNSNLNDISVEVSYVSIRC